MGCQGRFLPFQNHPVWHRGKLGSKPTIRPRRHPLQFERQTLPIAWLVAITKERMLVVSRRFAGFVLVVAILGLGGCNTTTGPCQRLFAWCQRDVRSEPKYYALHDPFPDETAGPDTATRPRAFEEPRSDTRRDFDLRLLLSMSGSPQSPRMSSRPLHGSPLVSPISPAVPIQAISPAMQTTYYR